MNFASFVICIILALIVTAIIVSLVGDKKKGKSSCGCNCAHCAMSDSCHKNNNNENKQMIEITLKIDGMMCGMCETHINNVIRNNFKIKKVTTSHTKGECIIISENEIDDEKLTSLITDTGYELKGIAKRTYEPKKRFL